ncbi:ribosome maturation factor RimP [Orrella daihaiensis]|uniref:Ribosome maturation factor RimP n=1 Tax=Orrella daihaiensis TaxID=2782176 RepID=A0ABY4AIK3_9BURK|nr:ribosome maturation factor RimP [Orrella daihaiensis]UOD49466.1 ribosome maturation factor RimP [Orrella daihaiensis]
MKDLIELTREAVAALDLEVVDVERAPLGLLRVTIDRPFTGEGGLVSDIKIEDCERVSRQLSRVFEVEGIDYRRLEVGSPGVDRPLRTERDFERFVGERIDVRLRDAVQGRRSFQGVLQRSCEQDGSKQFVVEYQENKAETKRVAFDVTDVERAKLDPLLDFKGRKR